MSSESPTRQIYDSLERAYKHFNKALFHDQLPPVLIVLQRNIQSMGHVSAKRWQNACGRSVDELSVNPEYFLGRTIAEVCATLCHEMCHIWRENICPEESSRRFYHDKSWARQMERIGLMPSHTGRPGGHKTGQKMSDYPIVESGFHVATMRLVYSDFMLPWIDMRPSRAPDQFSFYTRRGEPVDFTYRQDRLLMAPIGYQSLVSPRDSDDIMNDIVFDANEIIASIFGRPTDSSLLLEDEEVLDEIFAEQIREFSASTSMSLSNIQFEGFRFSEAPVYEEKKQTRVKYTCECDNNVWGRPGLEIKCCDCDGNFLCGSSDP